MTYLPPGQLRRDEPMSRHISWRAGGQAAYFYVPFDRQDLVRFIDTHSANTFYVIGLGSNLLVRDGGLSETVIQLHGALKDIVITSQTQDELVLDVEAGVPAPKVARWVAKLGYQGGEFLAGIPGTMGGALAMNAGCYGQETWNCVQSVVTMDEKGGFYHRSPHEYRIGYRHVELNDQKQEQKVSRLLPSKEWFIAAKLRFTPDPLKQGQKVIRDLLAQRVATQPLGQPNAGSVFRNPPGQYAAQLIERSGLKGEQEGEAQISQKHANFIVNLGKASATDIETLIQRVQKRVFENCGVALVPEVRIIGNAVA